MNGFHTVDLPGKSGNDLPLFVSGKIVTGVLDAAGNPFWFNGHVPSLGPNPSLASPTGKRTYDGSSRIDSGIPSGSGPPKPLKVTFTKPGTYKYFCDVHAGMIGYVVVKPKGKPVPSVKQDAAAVTEQLTTDIRAFKALAKTKPGPDQVSLGASNSSGVELFTMFPATLTVKVGTVVKFSMSRSSRGFTRRPLDPRNTSQSWPTARRPRPIVCTPATRFNRSRLIEAPTATASPIPVRSTGTRTPRHRCRGRLSSPRQAHITTSA